MVAAPLWTLRQGFDLRRPSNCASSDEYLHFVLADPIVCLTLCYFVNKVAGDGGE